AENGAESTSRMGEQGASLAHAFECERDGGEPEPRSGPGQSVGVPIGSADAASFGDEPSCGGRPPSAGGEIPSVTNADIPLLRDDHRGAETGGRSERHERVEEARVVGAA